MGWIDPTRDVAILGVGTTASHYQALQTGAIDATNLTPPFNFRAQEAGLRELVAFVKEDYLVEPAGTIGAELGAKKVATQLVWLSTRGFIRQRMGCR
jgi:ABC-type nitrate/sulfonate/bicarbonate transport system substrate-binding protein